MPDLGAHLDENGMQCVLFMTDWFMCAYIKVTCALVPALFVLSLFPHAFQPSLT